MSVSDGTSPGKGLRPRVGVIVSSWSKGRGRGYAEGLIDSFAETAPTARIEPILMPTLLKTEKDIPSIVEHFRDKELDAICIVAGNFTLDHVFPMASQALGLPTVLWGLPNRDEAWGALTSMSATFYPFRELGLPFRFVIGPLNETAAWERVLPYLRASALIRRLKGIRVGTIGWRAEGMSDVMFDELAIRETFGIQVVNLGMTRYRRRVGTLPESEVNALWSQITAAYDVSDLPTEIGQYGVRSYLAMKSLVAEDELDAITLECFHHHLGEPCLAFSMFNDQGFAAPCENDIHGAILMKAGQILSGWPTFHADMIKVNLQEDSAVLFHCGNLPASLADPSQRQRLRPIPGYVGSGAHGPIIEAAMRTGPVTLANLVGRRGTMRIFAMQGEVIPWEREYPGSGAKVSFSSDLTRALETAANAGYGHHYVLISGHVAKDLAEWCSLMDVEYLQPNP